MIDIPLEKRLVLALDAPDRDSALDLYRRTRQVVGTFKVGLELFLAEGPAIVERIRKDGADVFLDLKLHDIPNTVKGAVRQVARLHASLFTLHALGGTAAIAAAREALAESTTLPGAQAPRILAVTILTHHSGNDLAELGLSGTPEDNVVRLCELAAKAGADGCVCSPDEAARVRQALGEGFLIVTPGVRPEGAPLGDQARTATPFEAVRDGADYIVVGRPIRTAPDPAKAAAAILDEVKRGLAERQGA